MNRKHYSFLQILMVATGLATLAACNIAPPVPTSTPSPSATRVPPTATVTPTLFETATMAPSSTPQPTETGFPSLTPYRSPTPTKSRPTPTPYYARGDLHMHTTCSDGKATFDDLVFMANYYHYDFMAVTDHHWCPDVAQQCEKTDRILCFAGQEVTIQGGRHLLAIGIHKGIQDSLPVAETVALIHAQGALAIAAHPWQVGFLYTEDELLHSGLDAMECPITGDDIYANLASQLPCFWDSDTHDKMHVEPNNSTVCDMKITSIDDLRGAIYAGKCHR